MPSHNLASIKIDDLEIIGYSVAGEETVVAVPQLDDQIQTHFLATVYPKPAFLPGKVDNQVSKQQARLYWLFYLPLNTGVFCIKL